LLLENPGVACLFIGLPSPSQARTHMGTVTVTRWGDGAEKGRGTAEGTTEEGVRDVRGAACRGDGSRGRTRGPGGLNPHLLAPLGHEGVVRLGHGGPPVGERKSGGL